MPYPYTPDPLDAYMAAQTSVALVLMALLWWKPLRPWPACIPLALAAWMAALAQLEASFLTGMGVRLHPGQYLLWLRVSAGLATLAMAIARPRWIILLAFVGQYALWRLCDWQRDTEWELAAAHLVWVFALLGVHRWASTPRRAAPLRLRTSARPGTDIAIFVGATLSALVVAVFILVRESGSGDEWANTFQAYLFAHFKAFAQVPPCSGVQLVFWVFFYQGRAFAQYTPGWPLVMAPFEALNMPWLAAPIVTGVMAVGVARLARRAVAAGIAGVEQVTERHVRGAGILAAVMATLGPSMMLNGASRYPHPMVCACLAWSIEALCTIASRDTPAEKKPLWGLLLGTAAALLIACRPADGAMFGPSLFAYFVYALARRRIGYKPFMTTVGAFAAWATLVLVILRLQLGVWFKTGYDITPLFQAWAELKFKAALPTEIKHVVPLATGAYMWWPAAPAFGVAGLLTLRGAGRGIAFMLGVGACLLLAFYYKANLAHAGSTGYGPRLHLALLVSMAVGGGALLAPLWVAASKHAAGRSALTVGGPAVLVVAAIVVGVVRIAPLVYPGARMTMLRKTAPLREIARAHLHHAVVTFSRGETAFDTPDLLQNLPEKDPDVILLNDYGQPDMACARKEWADRTWWHARGIDEAQLSRIR
jgi:hypothetical protein